MKKMSLTAFVFKKITLVLGFQIQNRVVGFKTE